MHRILLFCVATTGCYAAPPVRAGGSVGGRAGATTSVTGHARPEASGVSQFHVGVTPGVRGPEGAARRSDVAIGWQFEGTFGDRVRRDHGPYVELAWLASGPSPTPGPRWRVAPTLRAEVLVESPSSPWDDRDVTAGLSVGLLLEAIDGGGGTAPFSDGEEGVGLAVRAGGRAHGDGAYGFMMMSVEFRLPAGAPARLGQ